MWEQALLSYNLPLTVLLGCVLLFWIVSLLGVGFDLDADADLDGDLTDGTSGFFGALLKFVNAHDVPLLLILSLLTLFMWMIAILSNYYLNPGNSPMLAGFFLIGNFFLSVLAVKYSTQPLRGFFRSLKNDDEHQEPLIGSAGIVKSRTLDQNFGQCEVPRPKGAPALLNCRLAEGEETLSRGDAILVIGYDDDTQRYIIKNTQNLQNQTL
jgi:hypothetical protein